MDAFVHFLNHPWLQLRFLPVSPLAQLAPAADAPILDDLLDRIGVFRQLTPALRDLDRLPQLRAYLGRPGRGPVSRFSDGSFRIVYSGDTLATCSAEVAHHHGRALADSGEPAGAIRVFEVLALKVAGRFQDLRKGHRDLYRPDDYRPSQAFGRRLKAEGQPGLLYGSVRRAGGACLGLFQAAPALRCELKQMLALQWDGQRLG